MFNIFEQGWKRWIETVKCPAPEPESYAHDDNPGFHEDDELSLIHEDGVIYQESIDGSKVALLLDLPGIMPSSKVSASQASLRKRPVAQAAPSTLISLPKGRCSKRPKTSLTPRRSQAAGEATHVAPTFDR